MNNKLLALNNTSGLDVGINEFLHRFSFNRNTAKLLENDIALLNL
jgi:hypothetical protein